MRSALTAPVSLLLFLVVWCGLWLPACIAAGRSAPVSTGEQAETPGRDLGPILGWGVNREDAQKEALKKAKVLLEQYLQEVDPPVTWRPSGTFIQQHLFKGEP